MCKWIANRTFSYLQAPPSFQPSITFSPATSSSPSSSVQSSQKHEDLITRYNLQSRVSGKGKEREEEAPAAGWQADKVERQRVLQRRRDEMILAARRKMQEKDSLAGGQTASSTTLPAEPVV
jgi:coupling of ubiquitin conjugation to ER degradation protein 1